MRRPAYWSLLNLLPSPLSSEDRRGVDLMDSPKPEFWAPVNMYDPTPDKVVKHIEQTIKQDLGYLGEIEIRGTITASHEGPLMHDVLAVIKNPGTFRYAQALNVRWDIAAEKVIYTNMSGRVFTPAPPLDAEDVGRRQGQEVVDKVMGHLHRTSGLDEKVMREISASGQNALVVGTTFIPTPVAGAVFLFATPWNGLLEAGLLAGTALASVAVAWGVIPAGRAMSKQVKHHLNDQKLFIDWRHRPVEGFNELFETPNERSAFMNMVLDQCKRAGITYDGQIKIRAEEWDNYGSTKPQDVSTKSIKGHGSDVLRRAVIEFSAQRTNRSGHTHSLTVIYDGKGIYEHKLNASLFIGPDPKLTLDPI